jgi:hypothetical protein
MKRTDVVGTVEFDDIHEQSGLCGKIKPKSEGGSQYGKNVGVGWAAAGALEQLRVGLGELLGRKVSGRLMRGIS